MNYVDVLARIREFVMTNFLYTRPGLRLGAEEPLLRHGVIDSMGVMELIAFVEDEFGFRVPDVDITEENFGTMDAIARYLVSSAANNVAA